MNEEESFLRAICENPDDDTPRLVFADWLTEQGGPVNLAWANGIRAQVWLARGATDEALRFQTCVFESSYGQMKLRERLDLRDQVGGWERGFPSGVSGSFDDVRDLWPQLAFCVPIRMLNIDQMTEDDSAEFVTWPALTVLRELVCSGVWDAPQSDVISTLAGCSELRNLKTLRLYNVLTNDATVTALLTSPHLAGLEVLQFGYEQSTRALSEAVKNRLTAQFGNEVLDAIPF
jgi:uncharacterized protein (TIGR02996 family)